VRRILLAMLLVGANAASRAQTPQIGSLSGKLTDLHSAPLNGATVIARNETTGAVAQGITKKNGSFRITGLETGSYTLEAASATLGHGRLEGILVTAGSEAQVQASMAFEAAVGPPIGARVHQPLTEGMTKPPARPVPQQAVQDTRREIRPTPTTQSPPVKSDLASLPLQNLDLDGHSDSPLPSADTRSIVQIASLTSRTSLAFSEAAAASAVTATPEFVPPQARPTHSISKAIDPVTPVVESTLTASELQALPAPGRRWQDFVLDTPTASATTGGESTPSLRGASQQAADVTLDGASTRTAFGGHEDPGPGSNASGGSQQNGMGQAWAGGHGSPVAEAAIREVQTAAGNAEADGMRTAGGRVNIETARGTNGLHGQAFSSDRQNTWGAENPFTKWVQKTGQLISDYPIYSVATFTPEPFTPPDHESVWGLGIGSQLRRDKLFWFGALDSYSRNDPGLAIVKHPLDLCGHFNANGQCTYPAGFFETPADCQLVTLAARLGFAGDDPTDCVSGLVPALKAYSAMLETLAGLLGPAPRTATQWTGFGRLDWQAAERHRFTLEGIGAHWNSPGGGLTRVSDSYGNHSFGSSNASEQWLLGRWEAFLTPNLLAVTQGSAGRTIQSAHAGIPSAYEQTLLAPNSWGQLPQIVVDNRYGFTIGNPSRFGAGSYPDEHLYQAQETVDWVHGTVLVKGGFQLSHNADATGLLRNQTGTYTYSSVENFVSDALVFAKFGLQNPNDVDILHGCDQTGTTRTNSIGQQMGIGSLPCYAYYSQMIGPTNWNLSTNDWAGFTTVQWQPGKLMVVSGGLRWEREQLPPPIAALANPILPLAGKMPSLGNDWGPRISMALGSAETRWPVLRLGYGMYFGRTENATIETALTQTGSPNGDLNFFMRPTDDCQHCANGAPAFPYVFKGPPGSMVKPGAVEFAPAFRNPEVHQAVAAVEEALPGHVEVTASALLSLGRRLPVSIDTNIDTSSADAGTITYVVVDGTGAGPIKTPLITVPFYASWPSGIESTVDCPNPVISTTGGRLNPCYQQINQVMSRANSTYEAAMLKIARYGRHGLSLHAHYTYAHATDWNPDESTTVAGSDVLDPAKFGQEYGTSNLDVRHSAAAMVIVEAPWKLHRVAGQFANGWMVSGIAQFHSGLPYTMRTSGSLPECIASEGVSSCTMGGVPAIGVALGPGMNGSGGDNRVSWIGGGVGRNTFRYPATWKADMRVGKKFDLGHMRELELLVESFNLFNHQNVTEVETTGYYLEASTSSGAVPTLHFLNGLKANTTEFGKPLAVNATNSYRERQIQAGVRMRF